MMSQNPRPPVSPESKPPSPCLSKRVKTPVPLSLFWFFDVAVIGAGPAGSLAAGLAAGAGFSTVIIEQKRLPRPKLCGGFLSARALSLLPADLILSGEQPEPIHTINVATKNRSYSHRSGEKLGLLIKREQFDSDLTRYASSKGALLLEESALTGLRESTDSETGEKYYLLQLKSAVTDTLRARYVIGADGARGNCAELFNLRPADASRAGWGLARLIETDNISKRTANLTFFPLPFLGGMGWSFSGPGWTNRGVGGLAKRHRLLKAYRRLFPEDNEKTNPAGWPLPFNGPLKKAASGNLLLIGDAAGLIDPFSGEGLYNSFRSSIQAVQALTRADRESCSAGLIYEKSFITHFRKKFIPSLAGAVLLHACSVICPSFMPGAMAGLMGSVDISISGEILNRD